MAEKSGGAKPKLPIKTGHLFIIGALFLGLFTSILVYFYANSRVKKVEVKVKTSKVVVANDFLPAGAILSEGDVKLVEWPKEFLISKSAFNSIAQVTGRNTKSALLPGELVYKEKLTGDRSTGGLSGIIPEGMRAVTVAITEVKGVAGFVKPGHMVDVLVTFENETADGEPVKLTKTVLQNVKVLATAQQMVDDTRPNVGKPEALKKIGDESEDTKKKKSKKEKRKEERERKKASNKTKRVSSITLALSPEQSEILTLAEETGDIRLVLRGSGDENIVSTAGAYTQSLLTGGFPADELAEPLKPFDGKDNQTVEFIQGSEKTSLQF